MLDSGSTMTDIVMCPSSILVLSPPCSGQPTCPRVNPQITKMIIAVMVPGILPPLQPLMTYDPAMTRRQSRSALGKHLFFCSGCRTGIVLHPPSTCLRFWNQWQKTNQSTEIPALSSAIHETNVRSHVYLTVTT